MKLGFIFDVVMLRDENNDYYDINFNNKLWEDRYLPIFKSMIVATRVKNMKNSDIQMKKGYTIANGKNVQMRPIAEYEKVTDVFFHRRKIYKALKEVIEQCDCVIIRLPSPLGNLACNMCRKMNKKYAIEMVACAWDGYRYHGHWAGKIVAPYMLVQTKKQCKLAKRAVYVTNKFLQKRYPTKGKTTNASNVMINEPAAEVLEQRIEKIKEVKDSHVLGLVGRLTLESKGQKVALQALKILVKKYPKIKIEFLGAGDKTLLMNMAQKLDISENVCFKGTLPSGIEVLKWMDSLDILLIPSFQEGLPRALIEAMSRGCPAVGAKTGGIPELIRENVIHNPGDAVKLAQDIEKIIENKDFAIQLAKENFENCKEYTKEKLDKRRSEFWQDFANECK